MNQVTPSFCVDDLNHPDAHHRLKALGYLAVAADCPPDTITRMAALLQDPVPAVCHAAAAALAERGPEARASVPALLAALRQPDEVLRRRVCLALGEIGPDARGAAPALLQHLENDTCHAVRRYAAAALGELAAPQAVAPLIERLASDDSRLRAIAMASLGRIGRRAVPRLQAALQHADPRVRRACVRLLSQCDQREAVLDALAALHQDANADVREAVDEALNLPRHSTS